MAKLELSKVEDIRDSVNEIISKLHEQESKLWQKYGKDLMVKQNK
jgi:hypothetical protein